jgi:ABC-type branched-subunit amino acid transport system ATPase component
MAQMTTHFILQTQKLTKEIKGFIAVDKVDLNVLRGIIRSFQISAAQLRIDPPW